MRTAHHHSLTGSILAGLLSLAGVVCFALATQASRNEVTISGQLRAHDLPMNDAVVVVELGKTACLRSELCSNGRFSFTVPAGIDNVRLTFIKPGFLTKEVVVDTRNALCTASAQERNQRVRFDVVLEEEEARAGTMYDGPVGSIRFVKGSGLMRVEHHVSLVPALPRDTGEFIAGGR